MLLEKERIIVNTVEQFKKQQLKTVAILERLLIFIKKGKYFEIEDNDDLIFKLTTEIDEVRSERLKVALIGGFSEGKTSIAAAWSENYDPDTMKIDVSESSDEIQVYHLDEFDLIDTPGLFGFKETKNQIKYKEITRKYISEANLILYVMSPNNPIRESHRDELEWLLQDLNLLSRTVFVISRFDEEANIEDNEDYLERFEVKKENIIIRLKDFGIISEKEDVSIVAVSANPFGEGFDYWLSNIEEYNQISHISDLQIATSKQIEKSGGKNALVFATSQSIVKDVIQRQFPIVQKEMIIGNNELNRLKNTMEDISKEQQKSEKNISKARIELRDYISDFFTDLILQAKGTDQQTINDFIERNIGDEGIVLETNIQNEFERHFGKITHEISKSETNFKASLIHYNSMVGDLTMRGIKFSGNFLKNTKISSETVFSARNMLLPSFKFKPWGAIKLAENLSKGVLVFGAVLGIGIEIWDSYSKAKKEAEFNKAKEKIIENLSKQRKDYIEFINDSKKFIEEYFPQFINLKNSVLEMEKEVIKRQNFYHEFDIWYKEGKLIESDFEVIV